VNNHLRLRQELAVDKATRAILEKFSQISAIPRCSKNEEPLSRWLAEWAQNRRLALKKDAAGNLCISIPATANFERAPTIILQGHLDMVCVKSETVDHDFSADPIRPVVEGDWVKAEGTTLGADNGIAVAMAMLAAEDPSIEHPPLELLFTVDEESGLIGAKNLDPELFDGRILLNLDSEEEGVFTVGCAGGEETRIQLPLQYRSLDAQTGLYRIDVRGIHGGHSGIDIHKNRASANKLMARILHEISIRAGIRIIALKGGVTHNAIAREARVSFAADPNEFEAIRRRVALIEDTLKAEYAAGEPSLEITLAEAPDQGEKPRALTQADTGKVIHLLMALPHGLIRMSADIQGRVETSCNLATLETKPDMLEVLSSQRSSVMSRLSEITSRIKSIAALAGGETIDENAYPAWQPNMESQLLGRCKTVYQKLYDRPPVVQTIHAGLECGIIGAKRPGMDMISFGPTIENPHSPEERLHIPSIAQTWQFLAALLKSF
jgi:dipeptidase D